MSGGTGAPDGGEEGRGPRVGVGRALAAVGRLPRPVQVGAAALVLVLVALGGWAATRGGGGGAAVDEEVVVEAEDAERRDLTACDLVTDDEVEEAFGQPFEARDGDVEVACNRVSADGTMTFSVLLTPAQTPAAFRALVTDPAALPIPDIGDEAHLWSTTEPPTGVLVARAGGQAVTFTFVGDPVTEPPEVPDDPGDTASTTEPDPGPTPDEVAAGIESRLRRVAELALPRVAPLDFEVPTEPDVSGETCAAITLESLAGALGVAADDQPTLTPLGTSGCTFSTQTGVNVTVEVLPSAMTPEQLDGLGRVQEADGETLTWTPEPVEGLGDHAVWLGDPAAGLSGELYALYGETAVRVTSSGAGEAPAVRDRAVAAMQLVGPRLAGG